MSVGHLARLLEAEGISTVIVGIQAFRQRLEAMTLPRVLVTPHLMGRPLGAPGERERQQLTVMTALGLLEEAQKAGTMVELNSVCCSPVPFCAVAHGHKRERRHPDD